MQVFVVCFEFVTPGCMLCADRRISHVVYARLLSVWIAREVIRLVLGSELEASVLRYCEMSIF